MIAMRELVERLKRRGDVLGVLFGLLFMAFPVVDLIVNPVTGVHLALVAVGLVVFVATYLALMLVGHSAREGRLVWAGLGVLTALAVTFTLAGGLAWFGLFIYAAAAAGMRVRGRRTAPPGHRRLVVAGGAPDEQRRASRRPQRRAAHERVAAAGLLGG